MIPTNITLYELINLYGSEIAPDFLDALEKSVPEEGEIEELEDTIEEMEGQASYLLQTCKDRLEVIERVQELLKDEALEVETLRDYMDNINTIRLIDEEFDHDRV